MRYLTIEQREMLQAWLNFRSALLRREIAGALRRSGGEAAISLANHLEEIDDEAVADLESSIEIAEIERDVRELREVELARAPESVILPEVGLAMQPIRLNRVVFPEPLGPLSTVTLLESIERLTPLMATNSLGFP